MDITNLTEKETEFLSKVEKNTTTENIWVSFHNSKKETALSLERKGLLIIKERQVRLSKERLEFIFLNKLRKLLDE